MENKNKNLTELVFILDRSGSMAGLESDTIGGFNSMIEKQKKEPGEVLVSTVLFDHERLVLHDRVPLEKVEPLTEKEYVPRGCTALVDAIGCSIHHIGSVHKYARPEDVPGKTIFVIITDGLENASRAYSDGEVRQMIRKEEEKYGWEFLFLGANMDAVRTAEHYGIRRGRSTNFRADRDGVQVMYDVAVDAISELRLCGSMTDWEETAEKNIARRRRK